MILRLACAFPIHLESGQTDLLHSTNNEMRKIVRRNPFPKIRQKQESRVIRDLGLVANDSSSEIMICITRSEAVARLAHYLNSGPVSKTEKDQQIAALFNIIRIDARQSLCLWFQEGAPCLAKMAAL